MRVVESHAKVRDILLSEGIEVQAGYLGRHISVDQAVAEFQTKDPATQPNQTNRPAAALPVIG